MLKRMNRNIDIKSRRVQQSVSKLDGFLRAEYNSEKNYLEYYAGLETLDKVISIKDQIIYGRRGTGKTHLLKALQEKLLADDQKYLPVYIDLRTFKPTLESNNDLYYALIIFQEIVVEVLKCVYVNLDYLYQEYTVEQQKIIIDPQRRKILALLEKFNSNKIFPIRRNGKFCLLCDRELRNKNINMEYVKRMNGFTQWYRRTFS